MGSSITLTGDQAAVASELFGWSLITLMVLTLAYWVLCVIARWKIFTKAGQKGWKSLIPIYAEYVQWRIGWKNTSMFWMSIILMVAGVVMGYYDGTFVVDPYNQIAFSGQAGIMGMIGAVMMAISLIIQLVALYKLFKSFGHGIGWLIGYMVVPNIMLLVLGFGSSRYRGARK